MSAEITRLEALLAKTETDKESALAEKHEIQIESRNYYKRQASKFKAMVPLQPRVDIANAKRRTQLAQQRTEKYLHGMYYASKYSRVYLAHCVLDRSLASMPGRMMETCS